MTFQQDSNLCKIYRKVCTGLNDVKKNHLSIRSQVTSSICNWKGLVNRWVTNYQHWQTVSATSDRPTGQPIIQQKPSIINKAIIHLCDNKQHCAFWRLHWAKSEDASGVCCKCTDHVLPFIRPGGYHINLGVAGGGGGEDSKASTKNHQLTSFTMISQFPWNALMLTGDTCREKDSSEIISYTPRQVGMDT